MWSDRWIAASVFRRAAKGARWIGLALAVAAMCAARADEADPTAAAATGVNAKYNLDVKKLFATNCSWCHPAYGMKGADGPKLAGTAKTREQVIHQIIAGKTPMPGFRKTLKDEQIQALADYIKALPAD
jgi:mono/diheme cytochrome c family protein